MSLGPTAEKAGNCWRPNYLSPPELDAVFIGRGIFSHAKIGPHLAP